MVFKKTIVQHYTNTTPFGFTEFVRGTLSLIQYGLNNNTDVHVNLEGSPFSQYLIVENYNIKDFPAMIYYTADPSILYNDLEAFKVNDSPMLVVTTNWTMNPVAISNYATIKFRKLIEYSQSIYDEASERVTSELLNVNTVHTVPIIKRMRDYSIILPSVRSPPADTDYSIIYVDIHPDIKYKCLDTLKLSETIRSSLLLDRNILLLSNDKCLTNWLSELLEITYIPGIPDDIDDPTESLTWNTKDEIVNFILLAECKKLYIFNERSKPLRKEYDVAVKMLDTSLQNFGFFYSTVEISPMPGFEIMGYNSKGLNAKSSITDTITGCCRFNSGGISN